MSSQSATEHAAAVVETFPPLSDEQKAVLADVVLQGVDQT